MAVACSSVATGTVRPHRSEVNTIRALMDLALPKFDGWGDRPTQARRSWMVTTDPPASPDPVCSTDLLRSPSPCLNLDALSSDDPGESVGLSDILVTLICGSDDSHTPVNSDQVLSDEDLPAAAGSGDRRQVIRIRDVSPDVQIVDISQVGRDWDSRRSVWGAGTQRIVQVSGCSDLLAFRPRLRKSGLKMTLRISSRQSLPGGRNGRYTRGGTGGDHPTLFASEVRAAVPWISSDDCL